MPEELFFQTLPRIRAARGGRRNKFREMRGSCSFAPIVCLKHLVVTVLPLTVRPSSTPGYLCEPGGIILWSPWLILLSCLAEDSPIGG